MRFFATTHVMPDATPGQLAATMDEEIAVGKRLYRNGVILQAYADTDRQRTFMIVEAPNLDAARETFDAYPQVRANLIAVDLVPLIGLPAIASAHAEDGTPLPDWWPVATRTIISQPPPPH
jgi:muconolactone delta-isomerase